MAKFRNVAIGLVSFLFIPACNLGDTSSPIAIPKAEAAALLERTLNRREACIQCSDTPRTIAEVFIEDPVIAACVKERDIQTLAELESLYCSDQAVITPTISLEGLQHFPNLKKIYVRQAPKVMLEFSKLPALRTVSVYGTDFETVDVSENTELRELLFRDENGLTNLDLTNNTKLDTLIIGDGKLEKLTLPKTETLRLVRISGTPLNTLDLSQNPGLEILNLVNNQLTNLTLPDSPALTDLGLMNNKLTEVDIPFSPNLEGADFRQNPLKALSISSPSLNSLKISSTEISEFDATNLPSLRFLEASYMPLNSIDLTKSKELYTLALNDTNLTTLDLSENTKLEVFTLFDNKIPVLDISHNPKLLTFDYSGGLLTKAGLIAGEDHPRKWEKVKF